MTIPNALFGYDDKNKEIGIESNLNGDREFDLEFIADNFSIIPLLCSENGLPKEPLLEVVICTEFAKTNLILTRFNRTECEDFAYYLAPKINNYSGFLPNRYYKHETGKCIKTYMPIQTIHYGTGILSESSQGEFSAVGLGQEHFEGWEEIEEEEFKTLIKY